MLGSAVPATATLHTTTSSATPSSPTRPSRLRGLSYLRSYTRDHLHAHSLAASNAPLPPLLRSTSTPAGGTPPTSPRTREQTESSETSGIQSGENGWVPSVQGRSGLSRDSLQPTSTSTESAAPEPNSSMTRSRAVTALGPTPATSLHPTRRQSTLEGSSTEHLSSGSMNEGGSTTGPAKDPLPTIRFIPHVETRSTRPSLQFTAMTRTLKPPSTVVRVGRYSERDNNRPDPNTLPVGFKSKVVSRRHCEFWCTNGQWYIKDVKSSSGTFLNHVRLSPPGQESRPYELNDGDTVQLGIDFKGGEEVIFRCVKIRIECNRGWQKSLNAYNTTAHKRLLKNALSKKNRDSDAASVNSSECSICLNPVAPCQALFVAPCSHVWHYKCVRNLIHGSNYPNFLCPNCRFVADLEADVEPAEEDDDLDGDEGEEVEGEAKAGGSRDDVEKAERERDEGVEEQQAVSGSSSDEERRRSRSKPGRSANITDDELAGLLSETALVHSSSPHITGPSPPASTPQLLVDQLNDNNNTPQSTSISASASSHPLAIPHPSVGQRSSSSDLLGAGARSTTPTSTTPFALAAGAAMIADGPMTPRNDVGPFVLDGSAGRDSRADDERVGIVGEVLAEEERSASGDMGR